MKTSRLVGLLVITGIAIGALLSAVLPDFGLMGLGPGGGIGNPPVTKPAANSKTSTTEPASETEAPSNTKAADEEPVSEAPPPEVVYVMIVGRNYELRRGPEGRAAYQPATLEAVVEAVQAAKGDDTGIRVWVEQKSSSRELTERALRTKLSEAGIPPDAVRWKDKPVDAE
jgi:hypothetical protein